MNFTFVTAYFELYREPEPHKTTDYFFNDFKKLAETNFPIIIFLDERHKHRIDEIKYPNIKIVLYDWKNIHINKCINGEKIEIPLSNKKDNTDFLVVMNNKPAFLKEALNYTDKKLLIWIDFGIFKITNDKNHFIKNFERLDNDIENILHQNKIIIPGGENPKRLLKNEDLMRQIYWRFLGGLVICPRTLVNSFFIEHQKEFDKLLNDRKMTWEVNYWCNIEQNNPDMIHYYRADHNSSMFGLYDVRIILVSMIKNEEKIIERCINSVKGLCNAFCITDTGSTDKTTEIVKQIIENNRFYTPGRLFETTFTNFGDSRTESYKNTVAFCKELGWNPETTYGLLLDADMKLVVLDKFSKDELTNNGYNIIQSNGHMDYYNLRLLKLNNTWKCVGVTHEYWAGPDSCNIGKEKIYINDIGDGGCKNDKFERDLRLLSKGIEDDPKNDRYHFYLAQTLKDLGRFKEAISMYKKRIKLGGWYEEIWYSHYMIAKCWLHLGDLNKCELWGNRAYEYRKSRAEPIYMLTNLFRDKSKHFKAYYYYKIGKSIPPTDDSLFVESDVYKHQFDYESTILNYYVFNNDRLQGLKDTVSYLNKWTHHEDNVYSNMIFYIQNLEKYSDKGVEKLDYPVIDNYSPSSIGVVNHDNMLYCNVRYVNYRIQPDGSYLMYDDNGNLGYNDVKTRNALVVMDNDWNILENLEFIDNNLSDIPSFPTNIKGLEDIRLLSFKDKIYYTATSREFSYDGHNRIVLGEYDIVNKKCINNKCLIPPDNSDCEKNWIGLNDNNETIKFIYKWHPMQIGELDENNKLHIKTVYDTPKIFKHYRGSSNLVEYNNKLWCITHGVYFHSPRKYYHQFVILNKETYKPERYSVPFWLNRESIEYCLGLHIENDVVTILFSQNDSNPSMIKLRLKRLNELFIDV